MGLVRSVLHTEDLGHIRLIKEEYVLSFQSIKRLYVSTHGYSHVFTKCLACLSHKKFMHSIHMYGMDLSYSNACRNKSTREEV